MGLIWINTCFLSGLKPVIREYLVVWLMTVAMTTAVCGHWTTNRIPSRGNLRASPSFWLSFNRVSLHTVVCEVFDERKRKKKNLRLRTACFILLKMSLLPPPPPPPPPLPHFLPPQQEHVIAIEDVELFQSGCLWKSMWAIMIELERGGRGGERGRVGGREGGRQEGGGSPSGLYGPA